jgi:hypothetical protein
MNVLIEYMKVKTVNGPITRIMFGEVIRSLPEWVFLRKCDRNGRVERNHLLVVPPECCTPMTMNLQYRLEEDTSPSEYEGALAI